MTDSMMPGEPETGATPMTTRHFRNRVGAYALMCLLASPLTAGSQSLSDLSLEDLMQIDAGQVFGASERLQPAIEAPASVSFITAQEIQRYGYRTLADILRGVRGIYVTNDRNFSFIGARGFGKPGDYNSRILLLINGHRVNDNVFGQAEIGAEFGLDAANFERVEIIRGPASSLYGDSAFFAVVNVITRSGDSLNGTATTVEAGTLGTQLVRGSTGQRLANGLDFMVSSTYERSDGVNRLYFPAFDRPETNGGIAEGLDAEGVKQFYGRTTFKGLAVTSMYGTRRRDVPTASAQTLFNQQLWRQETTDRHGMLDAYYVRPFGDTRLTLRASYDRFSYSGTYPMVVEPDGTPTAVGNTMGLGARWSASAGITQPLRFRQTLRAGVEYIDNLDQNQRASYVNDPVPFFEIEHSSQQQALYVQDEIKLGRSFIVNAGLRYDRYEQFDRVTPRAALIFLPSSAQSFKYLYGNAFRAPNEFELNALYFGDAVYALRPEAIDTHEFVWERYLNDRLRTSVSTYWYKADRLINFTLDDSSFLGVTFVNQGQVRAKGLELEAQMRLKGESRALVSYALQSAVDQQTHDELPNSPRHVAKGRISLPGPTARSYISIEGQYLSSRATLARPGTDGQMVSGRVSAAATANVTVVQPIGRAWELTGSIRNLFDTKYDDPVSDQHLQEAVQQNGRTARIGLTWKIGQR
jgi:outer membrane receptor for ferrienterochelin and colicins